MQDILKLGCTSILEWGPGMVLVVLVLFGLYKIAIRMGERVGIRILEALEKPAAALSMQASALTKQSDSMDKLSGALDDYVARDRSEHREILILLKMIAGKVNRLDGEKDGT